MVSLYRLEQETGRHRDTLAAMARRKGYPVLRRAESTPRYRTRLVREEHAEALRKGRPSGRTLRVAARDYCWLMDFRSGLSPATIAARDGVTVETVRAGLRKARARGRTDPDGPGSTIPLFPIGPLTPHSACPHRGRVPRGMVCMVCHNRPPGPVPAA